MKKRFEHSKSDFQGDFPPAFFDLLDVLETQISHSLLGLAKKPLFFYKLNKEPERLEELSRFIMALDLELETKSFAKKAGKVSKIYADWSEGITIKIAFEKGSFNLEQIAAFKQKTRFLKVMFSPLNSTLYVTPEKYLPMAQQARRSSRGEKNV